MYGPGAAVWGNDAFSRVINLVTRRDTGSTIGRAEVFYGLHQQMQLSLSGGARVGDLYLWAGASANRRDQANYYQEYPTDYTYDFGGPTRLDHIQASNLSLKQFSATEQGIDASVRLRYKGLSAQLYHRSYDLSSSWERAAQESPFVSIARFGDSQQILSLSHTFNYGTLTGTTYFDYSRYQVSPNTRFVYPTSLDKGKFVSNDYRAGLSTAIRLEHKEDYSVVANAMDVTVGLLAQEVHALPLTSLTQRWVPTANAFAQGESTAYSHFVGVGDQPTTLPDGTVVDPHPTFFDAATKLTSVTELTYHTASAYAQLLWYSFDFFKVTAGLRWDHSELFGHSVNPRVGLVSQLGDFTVLKLLYGHGYLVPTPWERAGFFSTDTQVLLPNPGLQPETLNAFELDWMQEILSWLSLEASAYVNMVDSIINASVWTRKYVYILEANGQRRRRKHCNPLTREVAYTMVVK